MNDFGWAGPGAQDGGVRTRSATDPVSIKGSRCRGPQGGWRSGCRGAWCWFSRKEDLGLAEPAGFSWSLAKAIWHVNRRFWPKTSPAEPRCDAIAPGRCGDHGTV